jgi:uncharacterized membrane protein
MARAALTAAKPRPRRTAAGSVAPAGGRIVGLDALRGLAIVAMIAYHFCFDLRWFGFAQWDFEQDARWIAARSLILGSFLLLAGVSLALAARRVDAGRRFMRHVAQIGGAALLVSAASYLAFPQRYIWFGVLHAIAVTLLLARPLVGHPRAAWILGVVVVAAGLLFWHPVFDGRALGWLGFMTHKPATEDYVPLFPWAGVAFVGVALGERLHGAGARLLAPFASLPRVLPLLGRHSLLVYLVHQPLLGSLLWLATRH